jgi:hypothetical protein
MSGTLKEKFDARVQVTPSCWIWKGSKWKSGYGRLKLKGKALVAHRLAYHLYVGEIPDGKIVLHRCDNPSCVNPDHLSVGTNKDNTLDMLNKGRHSAPKGVERVQTKLKEEDVHAIRKDNRKHKVIAEQYGVSTALISAIQLLKTWKHLPIQ